MRIVSRSSLGNVEAYTIQHRSVIVHAGVGGGGTGKQCVVLVEAGGGGSSAGIQQGRIGARLGVCPCLCACVLATVLLLVTRSVTAAAILDVDLGSNIAATYTDTAQG